MEARITASDLREVELLDTSTVAARVGLTPSRVAQLEREGRIVAVRTSTGRRVFLASDVEAFLSERGRCVEGRREYDFVPGRGHVPRSVRF